MRRLILVLCLSCLILLSCTGNNNDCDGDLFSIEVIDESGDPVRGLEIFVRNSALDSFSYYGDPYTLIQFSIQEEYLVNFEILNQQNEIIKTMYNDTLETGMYKFSWDGKDDDGNLSGAGGTRVFYNKLTCYNTETGDIDFEDSKPMCMNFPVIDYRSIIGLTDLDGKFSYNNKLAFPHLFNPETQDVIDENGNYICELNFEDSIYIRLIDPGNETTMEFLKPMRNSKCNYYKLVWDNPHYFRNNRSVDNDTVVKRNEDTSILKKIELTGQRKIVLFNRLYGNYPNPFN